MAFHWGAGWKRAGCANAHDKEWNLFIQGCARITGLQVAVDSIIAELADGRTISVPLAWSWRLSDATLEQRANWRLIGSGQGIHWPDVDEDISVRGMLDGVPAVRGRPRAA